MTCVHTLGRLDLWGVDGRLPSAGWNVDPSMLPAVDVVVVVFVVEIGGFMVVFTSCLLGNSSIILWFNFNVFMMFAILVSSAVSPKILSWAFCNRPLSSFLWF